MMMGVRSSQGINRINAATIETDMRADWSRDISSALATAMNSQKATTSDQKLVPQWRALGWPEFPLSIEVSGTN